MSMDVTERAARIESLAELEDGWLDGYGIKPTAASVQTSHDLLSLGLAPDHPPGIFPTEYGGLLFEWFNAGAMIEADIQHDGTVDVFHMDTRNADLDEGELKEGLALDVAHQLLTNHLKKLDREVWPS